MGLFEEFRERGGNTYYSERPTPPDIDVTTVIVTYLAVVLAAAVVMIVAGTRGHERWTTLFRLVFSLHTGVIIVVCNVSHSWQVSHVHSHSEYSLEVADGINADVSLYVGLKSINITLRGNDSAVGSSGRINYNEQFSFDRVQDIRNSYRAALERGLPHPIVYSLEFFSVDDGGFIWQRAIRSAGHFTSIILWTSFVSWFVANILLCFDLVRGLAMTTLTGCLMVTGGIVYHAMQPTKPLVIRFEDGLLIPVYGWAFWLSFAAGIFASLAGVALLVLNSRYPTTTARLFLIDDSQRDDSARQLYDYSPGPLKIDTPFSRRINRLACRRSDKTSTCGLSNNAFLLDDLPPPPSSCRMSHDANKDSATVACTSDRHDTDNDDGQSVVSCRSYVALSRADSSCRRASTAGDDADCDQPSYNTTCVVIERPATTCDCDDNEQLVAETDHMTNECDVTAPASTELTSAEFTSTT